MMTRESEGEKPLSTAFFYAILILLLIKKSQIKAFPALARRHKIHSIAA
jgi:hypothetical protein